MPGDTEESRRLPLTPEQRRVLGPARSRQDWASVQEKPAATPVPPKAGQTIAEDRSEESETTRPARRVSRLSRALQVQNIALFFGALFLLFLAFYGGKKFDYWRYQLFSRNRPSVPADPNKFPNTSAAELVDQAIVDERLGNWKDAADRFIAAKYKNLKYPGLLFRAGKLYYDHGNFDTADVLFERAIAFGENVDSANYFRGMIATGRHDYAAGQRFYEAAATAAPFNADYFYSWAEALRRDRRVKEAIMRYEQAALRAAEPEENICRFKVRMALLEAGETGRVTTDLEKRRAAGPLSVDWLMTEAALQIQGGRSDEAVRLVRAARAADHSLFQGHFAACAGDKLFSEASNKYPDLAEACRMQTAPSPTPH